MPSSFSAEVSTEQIANVPAEVWARALQSEQIPTTPLEFPRYQGTVQNFLEHMAMVLDGSIIESPNTLRYGDKVLHVTEKVLSEGVISLKGAITAESSSPAPSQA